MFVIDQFVGTCKIICNFLELVTVWPIGKPHDIVQLNNIPYGM